SLDESIVVLPVDPYVDLSYFQTIAGLERVLAETNADLALIGAKPTYPSEKYGYIVPKLGEGSDVNVTAAGTVAEGTGKTAAVPVPVERFREKPSTEDAECLIAEGALWNCGVFGFRLNYLINLLIEQGLPLQYEEMVKRYEGLVKTSFDYAVVEKAENI